MIDRAGLRIVLIAASAVTLLCWSRPSAATDLRVVFPYRDAELLFPGEGDGALAIVPDSVPAGERAPLVVLLHGVNMDPVLHMWLGARGFPDVSALTGQMIKSGASRPFILAAPSQTKGATSGRHMWQDFDLDDFVRAVDGALGARAEVDRDAVIVIGHSGGGCNPDGGLLRVARTSSLIVPRALLAIDTCIDEDVGAALGSAPSSTAVWVRWQTELWQRPIDRFRTAFKDAATASGHSDAILQVVTGLTEPVHEMILVDTFTTVIPSLLSSLAGEVTPKR